MTHPNIAHVNLVPDALRSARARRRCTKRWLVALVATFVLVGLPGLYIGGNAALSDPAIGVQIEQVSNQLSANQASIPTLQKQLAQLQGKQEVLGVVKNRIDWREVFDQFVSASDDRVRFTALSATGGGIEGAEPIVIRIEGIAPTQTDARAYVVSIERLKLFDQIELTRTARRNLDGHEVIEFQIIARVISDASTTGVNP